MVISRKTLFLYVNLITKLGIAIFFGRLIGLRITPFWSGYILGFLITLLVFGLVARLLSFLRSRDGLSLAISLIYLLICFGLSAVVAMQWQPGDSYSLLGINLSTLGPTWGGAWISVRAIAAITIGVIAMLIVGGTGFVLLIMGSLISRGRVFWIAVNFPRMIVISSLRNRLKGILIVKSILIGGTAFGAIVGVVIGPMATKLVLSNDWVEIWFGMIGGLFGGILVGGIFSYGIALQMAIAGDGQERW